MVNNDQRKLVMDSLDENYPFLKSLLLWLVLATVGISMGLLLSQEEELSLQELTPSETIL